MTIKEKEYETLFMFGFFIVACERCVGFSCGVIR